MNALFGVYGASGFGREIMPLLRDRLTGGEQLFFIDDAAQANSSNGHEILTWEAFLERPATSRHVCIAIANSTVRANLDRRCVDAGVEIVGVRAANVVVVNQVNLGAGAILCPFVTLTSNISIGRCFHANIYSYVAHDCRIGDYVTFAPGVKCNGNIVIEDHAYIGTGAILRQGTPDKPLVIGKGAIVGMGAVVTKDVPPGATVVGNPARPLIKA